MTNLVNFNDTNLMKAEVVTTSRIIAEFSGVEHTSIRRTIERNIDDFKVFGCVDLKSSQVFDGIQNRNVVYYELNEQQATLLMTYLRNTDTVRAFKIELVKQFFDMRKILVETRVMRVQGIEDRNKFTKAICDYVANDSNRHYIYGQYTNLVYEKIFGTTAKALRKTFGVKTNTQLRDYLDKEKLDEVAVLEDKLAVLIEFGMTYEEIKQKLGTGK